MDSKNNIDFLLLTTVVLLLIQGCHTTNETQYGTLVSPPSSGLGFISGDVVPFVPPPPTTTTTVPPTAMPATPPPKAAPVGFIVGTTVFMMVVGVIGLVATFYGLCKPKSAAAAIEKASASVDRAADPIAVIANAVRGNGSASSATSSEDEGEDSLA